MIEHRAIINRLTWMQQAYALKATDVVLQRPHLASMSRPGSSSGHCLKGPASCWHLRLHTKTPMRYRLDNQPTHHHAHFVPSMLVSFIDARGVDRCTSLQRLLCSGEALPRLACAQGWTRIALDWPAQSIRSDGAAIDVTAWNCPDDC
ncbi:acyl-CoA synthetase family protein [Sinorhizobium terangae]|uniref:hypothetical protein n=1 Tax=Sinorhizobium terangae TaxID=110322 RepID=UPI00362FCA9E